jgi:bifunctional non-homologous end joining protein LigD
MPLQQRAEPFDHPDWLFELKYDGFRALAHFGKGTCTLASRNGNVFQSFSSLTSSLSPTMRRDAVLDGEIVCVGDQGRPQFTDLLFRRGDPAFFAFDLLWCDGRDLRSEALIERKMELKRILREHQPESRLLYVDHIRGSGKALFQHACELDLEGIVAKYAHGRYETEREKSTWYKIRNRNYSQWAGRHELFERDRHREPVPGWHSCELACLDQ